MRVFLHLASFGFCHLELRFSSSYTTFSAQKTCTAKMVPVKKQAITQRTETEASTAVTNPTTSTTVTTATESTTETTETASTTETTPTASSMHINQLPVSCLKKTFGDLSMYEQIQNLSVCKQWNAKQLLFF